MTALRSSTTRARLRCRFTCHDQTDIFVALLNSTVFHGDGFTRAYTVIACIVMAYVAMAYTVMADIGMAYAALAYIFVPYAFLRPIYLWTTWLWPRNGGLTIVSLTVKTSRKRQFHYTCLEACLDSCLDVFPHICHISYGILVMAY